MSCETNQHKFFHHLGGEFAQAGLMAGDPAQCQRFVQALYDAGYAEPPAPTPSTQDQATNQAATMRIFAEMQRLGLRPPVHSLTGMPKPEAQNGYRHVYEAAQAMRLGRPLSPLATATRQLIEPKPHARQVTGVLPVKGRLGRCGACGRYRSTERPHACPVTATSASLSRALSRRVGLPRAAFPEERLEGVLASARRGGVELTHGLTGERIVAELDGLLGALRSGYMPDEWRAGGGLAPDGRGGLVAVPGPEPAVHVLHPDDHLAQATAALVPYVRAALAHGAQLDGEALLSTALLGTAQQAPAHGRHAQIAELPETVVGGTTYDAAAVMRAMRKPPDERFASVHDFAQELIPFASDVTALQYASEFYTVAVWDALGEAAPKLGLQPSTPPTQRTRRSRAPQSSPSYPSARASNPGATATQSTPPRAPTPSMESAPVAIDPTRTSPGTRTDMARNVVMVVAVVLALATVVAAAVLLMRYRLSSLEDVCVEEGVEHGRLQRLVGGVRGVARADAHGELAPHVQRVVHALDLMDARRKIEAKRGRVPAARHEAAARRVRAEEEPPLAHRDRRRRGEGHGAHLGRVARHLGRLFGRRDGGAREPRTRAHRGSRRSVHARLRDGCGGGGHGHGRDGRRGLRARALVRSARARVRGSVVVHGAGVRLGGLRRGGFAVVTASTRDHADEHATQEARGEHLGAAEAREQRPGDVERAGAGHAVTQPQRDQLRIRQRGGAVLQQSFPRPLTPRPVADSHAEPPSRVLRRGDGRDPNRPGVDRGAV
jgi:hypothetical protein